MSKKSLYEAALNEGDDVNWTVAKNNLRSIEQQVAKLQKMIKAENAKATLMVTSSLVSMNARLASAVSKDQSIYKNSRKLSDEIYKAAQKMLVPAYRAFVPEASGDDWEEVDVKGKKFRWKKNDLFKKNQRTQAALDIEIWKDDKWGWRPVKNLQMRTDLHKQVIKNPR